MESSVIAGRSQIIIVNGTRRAVSVAIYKRSSLRPSEPPIAWQVVSLPLRGKTAIFIPRHYQVCARYSFEPENYRQAVYQTNVLQLPHAPAGAGFVIEGVASPDRRTWGAVLTRAAASPGWYQIRVVNRFSIGVWSHVKQDGLDIFPPRILPPLGAFTEDLSSPFYLAVLPLPRAAGDLLPDSEVALTEVAVEEGETIKVQGGPSRGFRLSKTLEGICAPERKPRAQAAPKTKTRNETQRKGRRIDGVNASRPRKTQRAWSRSIQEFTNPTDKTSQGQTTS